MAFTEYYGSASVSEKSCYEVIGGNVSKRKKLEKNNSSNFFKNTFMRLKLWLLTVFLPQGYPESVSADYLEYQVWDTVQAFASSINRTLAGYAVLKGQGVGDATATVTSAMVTWILRDGSGMISRITFAHAYGSSLDCNSKQWRFFADALNDCATFVELIAPLAPREYFTGIMCTAGLAYSLVGVAGGCTRSALTQHQAIRNNMADVSAKDGSQETLVNLVALFVSYVITMTCANHFALTWCLFAFFTCLHLYANYQAVHCLVIDTFNVRRFIVVADSFIKTGKTVTPKEANLREPIIFSSGVSKWMNLGCSFSKMDYYSVRSSGVLEGSGAKFLMNFNEATGIVDVALEESADATDVIRASFQSYLFYSGLGHENIKSQEDAFIASVKQNGWNLSFQQMCPDEYRWSQEKSFKKMN